MQVGIDVGATKIESVVLEKDGQEKHRSRISCPKNYTQIITAIRDIHKKLEEHGINPIYCRFRHRNFWDAGLHCLTVDTLREGNMQSYFK